MTPPDDARPLVTVVTPSLDQGQFLGDTLESVACQDYPHIEHLVFDGGSTDESLEVLRAAASRYPRLRWWSEPDRGQSDAINRGLRRASGSIVAWLNADDVYRPGAVAAAVEAFRNQPSAGLVYGRGEILGEGGEVLGPFAGWEPFRLWRLIHGLDYILQPATFFRRDLVQRIGGLDISLHWAMDWDLWIRLAAEADVVTIDTVLAGAREHAGAKTATGGWRRIRELMLVARRHAGRSLTPGVRLYALDTLHRQLGGALPGVLARPVQSLVIRAMEQVGRRMPMHADGWLGPVSAVMVPRRWLRAALVFESHEVPETGVDVHLAAESRPLAELHLGTSAVAYEVVVELPPGDSPFVTLDVSTDHRFRAPQPSPDRRLLSLILSAVSQA